MGATAEVLSSIGDVSLDATVQCVAGTLTSGGVVLDSSSLFTINYPWTPNVAPSINFTTYSTFSAPSKFEQAFKVASHLLEKKLIKEPTLRQFISLVGEIAGCL